MSTDRSAAGAITGYAIAADGDRKGRARTLRFEFRVPGCTKEQARDVHQGWMQSLDPTRFQPFGAICLDGMIIVDESPLYPQPGGYTDLTESFYRYGSAQVPGFDDVQVNHPEPLVTLGLKEGDDGVVHTFSELEALAGKLPEGVTLRQLHDTVVSYGRHHDQDGWKCVSEPGGALYLKQPVMERQARLLAVHLGMPLGQDRIYTSGIGSDARRETFIWQAIRTPQS